MRGRIPLLFPIINPRVRKSVLFHLLVVQIFFTLPPVNISGQESQESCTIGVASGAATADGRPLIWKSRDYIDYLNNEVWYYDGYPYAFVSIVQAGEPYPGMGVNEMGFAILNSLSTDLPKTNTGPGNSLTMRYALGTCATVVEFEQYLESTNTIGRQTQANMAVLDATGAAAIYEVAGSSYWKYDANDSTVAPEGYVLRTNFALHGDGSGGGYQRYDRQQDLIREFCSGDSLNYQSLARRQMRDFSDVSSQPISIPYPHYLGGDISYGYMYTNMSICRYTTVSAVVIQGILHGEPPELSTMWALLGQPAATITVPYWPVGQAPLEADGPQTAPLCDISLRIKELLFDHDLYTDWIDTYKLLDGQGGGLWSYTFPAEDSIFSVAETLLAAWRSDSLDTNEMLAAEDSLAQYALSVLNTAYEELITLDLPIAMKRMPASITLGENYPNPFNSTTMIGYQLPQASDVSLIVYDILGREVARLVDDYMEPGYHRTQWNGRNSSGREVPSGIYITRLVTPEYSNSIKMVLLK